MKKITKNWASFLFLLTMLTFFSMSQAAAGPITIGTMTGTGTVTVDINGQPTGYSFLGPFHFDNVTPVYNGLTLASLPLMNDLGQYFFTANSSATVPANDWDSVNVDPAIFRGTFQWVLDNLSNPAKPNSTLYGSVLSFAFQGTEPTGTVTGSLISDGFIHWYYGYDNTVGFPAGKTPLAALGLTDTSNFAGTYTVTGYGDHTVNFSLSGTFTTNPVPEPATMMLLGSGLIGLAGWGRRKFRKA